jgi:hypothetical protein
MTHAEEPSYQPSSTRLVSIVNEARTRTTVAVDLPPSDHVSLKKLAADRRTSMAALAADGIAYILRVNGISPSLQLADTGRKQRGRRPSNRG